MRRMKDRIEGSITNAVRATVAESADKVAWSGVQDKPATYTPSTHTHTKDQILDFPTSMPASDVFSWAKASSKPNYTKAEVGLANVDDTADKDKNVKYAASAGSASSATNTEYISNENQYMRFHWTGQGGQPSWLWGSNDAKDMYVYNPSNFNVKYASSAGTASQVNGFTIQASTSDLTAGYSRLNNNVIYIVYE